MDTGLLDDAIGEALQQLLAADPTFGDRYRAAADKHPFLTEIATKAGGAVADLTISAVDAAFEAITG